jgi:hypothetical protein
MKIHIPGTQRELERLGPAVVFRTASKSRPGIFHYQSIFQNGQGIKCSCEGFSFNGRCWHIELIPLCLEAAPEGVEVSAYVTECRFVDQHEGGHSWETVVNNASSIEPTE